MLQLLLVVTGVGLVLAYRPRNHRLHRLWRREQAARSSRFYC